MTVPSPPASLLSFVLGICGGGWAPDAARAPGLFGSGHRICPLAPLRMYLFGTVKGHKGPGAISNIVNWFPL